MLVQVVIPYRPEDEELALNTQVLHQELAGIDCNVVSVRDNQRIGWVGIHNRTISKLDFDYYCYSAADYVPERDYLKLAIEKLIDTGKGLCCFDDGKWDGKIASVGVVAKAYYDKYGLFHDAYKSHGADDEITKLAMKNNEYVYEPRAKLVEIPERVKNKNYNREDQALYYKRLEEGLI